MNSMVYQIEQQGDNKVKLTVTIPAAEVATACQAAATHLAEEVDIPGFRPGKAPYEMVKQKVGEMAILEHAAEDLVRSSFIEAMVEADLETVGQPYFTLEKLAPDNDFVYTAEVALMPKATKLADYNTLSVDKKDIEPAKPLVDEAKNDLLRMQTKEVRAESGSKLEKGNKAVVHMTMKHEGVVMEGGEAKNHGVYTNENYYVPGFVDEILGLGEGEEKTFSLKFPDEHYQKHIAGKEIEFNVKMNEIFLLQPPLFDDEFAKSLGLKDAGELEEKLVENLREENRVEEARRLDKAVLDLVAEKSTFDTIPDLLVNQEIEKMIHELEHQVETQGLEFKPYLSSIGKSLADLKLDFAAPALQRIKVGIVLKAISEKEGVKADDAEVDAELDKIAGQFDEKDENRQRVYEPQYRDYIERQMINRKTIDLLKEKIAK